MAAPPLPIEAPPLAAGQAAEDVGGEDLGEEDVKKSKRMYFVTLSHPTQARKVLGRLG